MSMINCVSPEHEKKTPGLMMYTWRFTGRWNSPKNSIIKYDSQSNIVDVPEEYEEFLRKKFSRLAWNRSSNKRLESRNSYKIFNAHTASINSDNTNSINCSKESSWNKENEFIPQLNNKKELSTFDKRKLTLKSLTRILLTKELNKKSNIGLHENINFKNINQTGLVKSLLSKLQKHENWNH